MTTKTVTHPDVYIQLAGEDGNAFNIIGIVERVLRKEVGSLQASIYVDLAMTCNSYDELLQFTMKTVNVS